MLETWLERVDPPTTWATIIEAVEFLGEEQLGEREVHSELGLVTPKYVWPLPTCNSITYVKGCHVSSSTATYNKGLRV